MTSRLTSDELAVIEAAVDWDDLRTAANYGPVTREALKKAEANLEKALASLHAEHDGRWTP